MKQKKHLTKVFLAALALLAGGLLPAQNFAWARAMGGTDPDNGTDIAVDAVGNVYSVGHYSGTADLDPGPGTCMVTNTHAIGHFAIYISKLDASGNFVWGYGFDLESANTYSYTPSIALDANGDVIVAGIFRGTIDFDPGPGTAMLTGGATDFDTFILKLTAAGTFVWVKKFSGYSHQVLGGLALDAAGNIYTTGYFADNSDFDPGPGTYILTTPTTYYYAVFVCKLDANGNFVWARKMGGDNQQSGWGDMGKGIALDASGNVYVSGSFDNAEDFDPGAGTLTLTATGTFQAFVLKLDNAGNFQWAKNMGGSLSGEFMRSNTIVVNSGTVYYGGDYTGVVDFDPGPGTTTIASGPGYHAFISALDLSGNLLWAKALLGGGITEVYMTPGIWGGLYVTGAFTDSIDFDMGPGVHTVDPAHVQTYVASYDAAGNFGWVLTFEGGNTNGYSIVEDALGNLYLTGALGDYWTVDFDPGPGVYNLPTPALGSDSYVVKLSPSDLGAMEMSDGNALQLFPNPANEMIHVRGTENTTLQLFDVTGALVRTYAMTTTELRLDVSDLSNGIYLLVAETNEGKTVTRFQVAH